MRKLKNNSEYAVFDSNKKQVITKFKTDLGIVVKFYMIEKVW